MKNRHRRQGRFDRRAHGRWCGVLAELALVTPRLALAQTPVTPREPTPAGADVVDPGKPRDAETMVHAPGGVDASFVDAAGRAGVLEVQASQWALQQIAARKGIRVPAAAELNPQLQTLANKQGREFDLAYVAAAGPAAQQHAVRLFQQETDSGRDPELKAFARSTLPVLQRHLTMARKLATSVARAA